MTVEKDRRYHLSITIGTKENWKDGEDIKPGLSGFGRELMTPSMYPGVLFRRYIREPWFKPIARIGSQGSDEYLLAPVDPPSPGQPLTRLDAEITARRSGELFLFVNDAVLPVPKSWQVFYNNNQGTATVPIYPVVRGY
jgi:hypothetical protein